MEYRDKEVYFHEYCDKCKYSKTPEDQDPCDMCLTERKREFTHTPLYFDMAVDQIKRRRERNVGRNKVRVVNNNKGRTVK